MADSLPGQQGIHRSAMPAEFDNRGSITTSLAPFFRALAMRIADCWK